MGQYRFCVGPGNYALSLAGLTPTQFVVDSNKEIVADLIVPTEVLQGKVIDTHDQPVPGVLVAGFYNKNVSDLGNAFYGTATTDNVGAFDFHRELVPLALAARTQDGRLAGIAYAHEQQKKVSIRLVPLVEAHGRLIDRQGNSVGVGTIEYGIVAVGSVGLASDLLHTEATVDSQGRYTLTGLLPGGRYQLRYKSDEANSRTWPFTNIKPTNAEDVDLGDTPLPKDVPSR